MKTKRPLTLTPTTTLQQVDMAKRWSARAMTALEENLGLASTATLLELSRITPAQWDEARGCGKLTRAEIFAVLVEAGLRAPAPLEPRREKPPRKRGSSRSIE